MGEFMCIGDQVCLYSQDTAGYVFSFNSSSVHNKVYVYTQQSKENPGHIPNPHAVTFELCARNRYKLDKTYRKLAKAVEKAPHDLELQAKCSESKLASVVEHEDNDGEQKRQRGRRLRYGQIIQLRHLFSGKYLHVSSTQTSLRDKNFMMVHLQEQNAKQAMFRILPRYKVKSEGDIVQINDQVVMESVKSPGQYLHTSAPWLIYDSIKGAELNLGVHKTGFSICKYYRPQAEHKTLARGGVAVRLFHKEIEANLVAEGVFNDKVVEGTHLRVRSADQAHPKTMFPSTCSITYWQIEAEDSILNGDILKWEQQVRLRHMTTRLYMCIGNDGQISLTDKGDDPKTVFRFHAVMQEQDEIAYQSYARIEHVLTGLWLHAEKGNPYVRRDASETVSQRQLTFKWNNAPLRKVSAIKECMYDDAFTIQLVNDELMSNFNYVAGMVPMLHNLIKQANSKLVEAKVAYKCLTALYELRQFMIIDGLPDKDRQKLLRNLKVVDLLVRFLQTEFPGRDHRSLIEKLRIESYRVLETYLLGNSRKNELYFAKHIDYFATQFGIQGEIGLRATQMITELIRDNRKVVDRIAQGYIERVVALVKKNKNYRYLDLLGVLCVCDGIALPENQNFITKMWLVENAGGVYLTELGEKINKEVGRVYVSKDGGNSWIRLFFFCDCESSSTPEEEYLFLEHQLELFANLCYGRNEYAITIITRSLGYCSWDETFRCLKDELLPDALRAKYCDLVISLFIDVGTNQSILDHMNLSFMFGELGGQDNLRKSVNNAMLADSTSSIFPELHNWISTFLDQNKDMTASQIGHNMLIEQVLRLVNYLMNFGYYGDTRDIKQLLPPLLKLLDGRNDKPIPLKTATRKEARELQEHYHSKGRFEKSEENMAVVNAKYRAMEVVDLILNLQFNIQLEKFITLFKDSQNKTTMTHLTTDDPPLTDQVFQKKVLKDLKQVIDGTVLFDVDHMTAILMDLSQYKYDKMIRKSVYVLNKLYSTKQDLFEKAIQAQVVMTDTSCAVHREIGKKLSILRRLAHSKIGGDQAMEACDIMNTFAKLCCLDNEPDERHPINQTILVNHGILDVVFSILQQDVDLELLEQYMGMQEVIRSVLHLLRCLTRGNQYVQNTISTHLDFMLSIRGVEAEVALVLIEVFTGNQATCMKIMPGHIQRIVQLAAKHQQGAPEYLDLLCAIVKVEELNLPLKRNQGYVIKYIMQAYQRVGYVLDQTHEQRLLILKNNEGEKHLSYLVSLVDVLATCAEGENQFIESLCQTILPADSLIGVLNDPEIDNNLKRPFLRFLLWVYLNTAGNIVDIGFLDLPEKIGASLKNLVTQTQHMEDYIRNNKTTTSRLLKKQPAKTSTADTPEGRAYGTIHYFLEAALPFIEVFYKKGFNVEGSPELLAITDNLAKALVAFSDVLAPLISNATHMRTLVQAVTSILSASHLEPEVIEGYLNRHGTGGVQNILSESQQTYYGYYEGEQELNRKLNLFAKNVHLVFQGPNTVEAQIGYPSQREYTEGGQDEDLPLGEEFQSLVKVFTPPGGASYWWAGKLIEQLNISATKLKALDRNNPEQVQLDVKCLQVLRALIHNEVIKLPENWVELSEKQCTQQLSVIKQVQDGLNGQQAVFSTLPLTENRRDRVVQEYWSFLIMMLFNANKDTQKSFEKFFLGTREEMFFFAVKEKMNLSVIATKEKRYLAAQHESRLREAESEAAQLMSTMTAKKKTLKALNRQEDAEKLREIEEISAPTNGRLKGMEMSVLRGEKQSSQINRQPVKKPKLKKGFAFRASKMDCYENEAYADRNAADPTIQALLKHEDEGHIELLVRVLAGMCDGQNTVLQNYLREQPDNIKSANLIAETTSFLGLLYSRIEPQNIDLVIEIFSALVEFASGNPANHHVIFDNNIVDYINYILRLGHFPGCSPEKELSLMEIIGRLVNCMVDEDRPETTLLVKEIADTLDLDCIVKVAVNCKLQAKGKDDKYQAVGFQYHFLLERLVDLLPDVDITEKYTTQQEEALHFYSHNSMAIEIVKNEQVQKARFRVKDEEILRDEVKDKLKWHIDRSTPSNKVRELLEWSEDIIDDIYYHRKILSNPLIGFFVRYWKWWNSLVMFLSLIINVIMLATWDAPGWLASNASELPPAIHDPKPVVPAKWYYVVLYILGALHNVLSLIIVVTWFVSSRPQMPKIHFRRHKCRSTDHHDPKQESRLRVKLLSFQTLYYLIFMAMSILGTACYGYFFAFHMLNIVYNNQLLQRVISAITMNGKSLLWVTVLGMIIIYIFALAAFAFLRGTMSPDAEVSLYCASLAQCTVTVLRFGLIGELFEHMQPHESELSFHTFGLLALFHIVFFIIITTIGLNIIFGIILDTFSELRNMKQTAEDDMNSLCFICSRGSHEFESHAQGFDNHVKNEHNMWAYIFFFIHLDGSKPKDMTDIDLHVSQLKKEGRCDFFPLGRALALTGRDEDETQVTIHEILNKVNNLINKQQQEETEKQRQQEKRRQQEWKHYHQSSLDDRSRPKSVSINH